VVGECPDWGGEAHQARDEPRIVTTTRGDIPWTKRVRHRPRCRRFFFPPRARRWGQWARGETAATNVRRLRVRLSGRQLKRGREFTETALVSGVGVLLAVVRVREHHDRNDLLQLAQSVLPTNDPPEIPLQSAV
jgi:hypothetical protein